MLEHAFGCTAGAEDWRRAKKLAPADVGGYSLLGIAHAAT